MARGRRVQPEMDSDEEIVKEEPQEDAYLSDEEEDEGYDGGAIELPKPEFVRRRIRDLYELLEMQKLDVHADYQREAVWDAERQSGLINSLLTNFYIPPIIVNIPLDREDVRVVVDGKQRLTSIKRFLDGEIPCLTPGKRKIFFRRSEHSERIKSDYLNEDQQVEVEDKELLCVEYAGLSYIDELELFRRVQMGMPLTEGEKMRATQGKWQNFAAEILRDFTIFPQIINRRLKVRDRVFQFVLNTFAQIIEAEENEEKSVIKSSATAARALLAHQEKCTDDMREKIRDVYTRFERIIEEEPETFEAKGRNHHFIKMSLFSPVEFLGVCYMLFRYKNRNVKMLAGDIVWLRIELRNEFHDLRANSNTWKVVYEKIDQIQDFRGQAVQKSPVSAGKRLEWTTGGTSNARVSNSPPLQRAPPQRPANTNGRLAAAVATSSSSRTSAATPTARLPAKRPHPSPHHDVIDLSPPSERTPARKLPKKSTGTPRPSVHGPRAAPPTPHKSVPHRTESPGLFFEDESQDNSLASTAAAAAAVAKTPPPLGGGSAWTPIKGSLPVAQMGVPQRLGGSGQGKKKGQTMGNYLEEQRRERQVQGKAQGEFARR